MSTVKHKILTDTFKTSFSLANFQKFTREFFNEPNMLPESRKIGIWREYDNHISSYHMIANYKDSDGNNILVMAVELKKGISVEKARSMQRNFISKILDTNNYEASIVAFYTQDEPNWRLSFVRLDYTLTTKGVEIGLTPAKRFSYLVGENEPNHTAQAQLLKIFEDDEKNPTLDEIEEAFSVEKVTKDFFNEYREKYLDLKEYLEGNDQFINETKSLGLDVNKFAEQFAKKLMGQLAFLYFLQKKGWLGVRILPENRMLTKPEFQDIYDYIEQANKTVLKKVFKENKDGYFRASAEDIHAINDHEAELLSDCFINTKYNMPWGSGNRKFIKSLFEFCDDKTELNFFHDYLEPFFYGALNRKRKNHYFKRFNCKIPFLNGGLFEPIEGYHWNETNLNIPNHIFSNKDEKGRDADGILDIFDKYNFTMNEDEPLEKEVAIDPEMLGKIFENLLDVSDRKSKGAFYTPREIVHYMCQESLINYLVNKVGVPYDDMKEFILYGEMIRDADNRKGVANAGGELTIKPTVYNNIVAIDRALENVKVADPAVGSGAFPLGMLNEIVKARNNITEYMVRINKEGEFNKRYDEKFIRARRSEYKMKWDTIKNSIFAVDIEPSAVDIAKLRLWLSVVVDQEIDENNPEPHPLPNLDQNIMVGNSLIDEFEGIKLFDESLLYKENNNNNSKASSDFSIQMNMLLDQSDELLDDMFKLQDRYFGEDNEERKKEIKIEIDKIRDELIRYKLQNEGNIEGLKRYEESLKNKTKPYFIWELEFAKIFKDNGGFDIVIGNPPYVKIQNIDKNISNTFKLKYKSATGKYDLYVLFIEKSFMLINSKGITSFIHPHRFLKAEYGKGTRELLKSITGLKRFIYFGVEQIFDTATTYTGIFFYDNYNNEIEFSESNIEDLYNIDFNKKKYSSLSEIWNFDSGEGTSILEKINAQKHSVKDICKGVYQGVITAGDDIFIMNGVMQENDLFYGYSNELKKDVYIEKSLMKPLVKGEHIRRNLNLSSDIYIFYPHNKDKNGKTKPIDEKILEIDYPLGYKYISNFKEELTEKKIKYKTNTKYWYSLHRARDMNIFENKKIITPQLQNYPNFTIDEECFYPDAGGYSLVLDDERSKDIHYYLGILNSKVMWYFIKSTSTPFNSGYYYFKTKYIEPFRFPDIVDNKIKYEMVSLVKDIINIRNTEESSDKDQHNIIMIENKINEIVYKLYNLTDKEIKFLDEFN